MAGWQTIVVEFKAMASPCSLHVSGRDEGAMCDAAHAALDEVRRIEHTYSRYRPDSIVSRINQAAGRTAVDIDDETADLLRFADRLWQQSDGLFDITSGVLRTVWDFKRAVVPSPEALKAALERIGWNKVELTASSVRLAEPGMELDFGGFGKEYAADRAAVVLKTHGIDQALINLGGDLHALRDASNPAPATWTIDIQHPRPPAHAPQASVARLQLSEGGLATSGDYERFFVRDGRRFCHILNPLTGWPISDFQSVSVCAGNTTTAGALATIAMLKGADAAAWLASQEATYLAVTHDGELRSGTPLTAPSPQPTPTEEIP